MSKLQKVPSVAMPTPDEDRAITRAARADPDAQPMTAAQLEGLVPLKALRGRPPSAHKKQLVSVRYSPEVLTFFKATGEGWQARMDGVLKTYVAAQSRKAKGAA